jgi:ATP-dependent helicase/nuclease subunit A
MHHFVFSLRERLANEKDLYVYTEFRNRYAEVWATFIDEFFRNVGLYPLYELVITIYGRFNVPVHGREDQGFLMHFLELVKKAEEEHTDITSFLEYFETLQGEDLYVHITDSDAVKILTIHKAKGLEFPVVILPYLGMDIQIGSSGGEYQPSYILQQDSIGMALLRIKTKYLKFSEGLERVYAGEYKKAFLSELNSIYVALTRAQNELYGFIPKKIGNSFNCARFLIPEEQYRQGRPQAYKTQKPKDVSILEVPPASYPDWIDYLKDEFLDAGQLKNREQRLKGEVMHYTLAFVTDISGGEKEEIIQQAFRETERCFPRVDELPAYQARISELLDHPDMRRFFYCEGAEVVTEKEIVNSFGHTKRCDRLVIREGEVWIIDFKSTKDMEGCDRQQVEEYRQILEEIYPDKDISGYLIYLDSFEVEKI